MQNLPNLNEVPQHVKEEVVLDLNQPLLNQDLDLVIINPLQPMQEGDPLENIGI